MFGHQLFNQHLYLCRTCHFSCVAPRILFVKECMTAPHGDTVRKLRREKGWDPDWDSSEEADPIRDCDDHLKFK